MINLEELVSAIQQSALSASSVVAKKNLEILDEFFERYEEDSDVDDLAKSALSAIAELDSKDTEQAEKIKDVLNSLSDALKKAGHDKAGSLAPKLVNIEYPNVTKHGVETHTVSVPLLSLIPINSIQLSELKFTTDLDISLVEDKLQIAFPDKPKAGRLGKSKDDGQGKSHHATLEVVIDCKEPPQGLQKLVEGYDRALRAQIPG